jgi:prepilin-type N-terminal cleavage/methylation domain-containing protein
MIHVTETASGERMKKQRAGFTFIEILIAMLLMGALSAIAVPRYRNFKEKAYLATLKSDLGNLRIAQEAYWSENMVYAPDSTGLDWKPSSLVRISITSTDWADDFTATATHDNMPSAHCVTHVGRTGTVSSGEIICHMTAAPGGSAITP